MTDNATNKFKLSVERNFDQSVHIYDAFEEKHHLFEGLTRRLCELVAPATPARILDVGCGTGISTKVLAETFPYSPVVYAIDISERMLAKARERCAGRPGIYIVRADAERLAECFNEAFDAVFYTASIFLIPNFRASLDQACRLVLPGGIVAMSFYAGLFDEAGNDAVAAALPGTKYQYGAVRLPELKGFLGARKDFTMREVEYRFEADREFLFDFLSIPAQSAGLFPRIPYIERIPLVREIVDRLGEKVSPLYMGWTFLIARRSE